ncbi:SDR family NAD(P)-dependent oxidoreductase [Neobacillus sp. PS2-9]|uniref:SDR family NAD(P)-dependent oxidoreductase n=1 Tax=Neobacillus sp. PS2-9 TaxID=3070676 RepID=UPI0027DEF8EE|nr:SDR family NAD(P)-dependent oxidoreductase [Neobacillus sp. PS2-9]WML58591.1 SDR family NAD(P)-dependent oxidoreductase [Neobacillus sp. PS2-9]
MNVLVTGGSGFIGSHTVDLLVKQGYTTIVVDQNKGVAENPNALYFYGDITDHKLIEDLFTQHSLDAVIHLAAQVSVETSMKDPVLDVHVNVLGTLNLLEQCRKHHAKIVFASSAAVYGLPENLPIAEDHPVHPISVYGLSKLTVEKYIQLYHEQFGVEYCTLRYSNVYGPRQGHTGEGGVISIFLNKLTNGQAPFLFGDGEQTRDFIYVEDVAMANIYALRDGKNQVFNVSSMTETSINSIVDTFTTLLNSDIQPIQQPPREGDITRSVLDASAIHSMLNWTPAVDIRSGLASTIRYFIEEKGL